MRWLDVDATIDHMNKTPAADNPFADADSAEGRRAPPPCAVVLFGASGDLTRRKLVPAIYNLLRDGHLPGGFAIVGFARRDWSDDQFRAELLDGVREHARSFSEDDGLWERLAGATFYHRASFDDAGGFESLGKRLAGLDDDLGTGGNRLFYLATAPEYFAPIVGRLGAAGLVQRPSAAAGPRGEPWTRVIVEKPFGHDVESARELNCAFLDVLDESQIYRIDHYLGKETVQNILAFRFSNGIFEPLWNQKYIDHVQITVSEDLGVGSRGPYYESSGALRDMMQNHILQLLSLVAMEPPVSLDADAIRDEKVKVLRSMRPLRGEAVLRSSVRGQYVAGSILGEPVPGYREEERVDPASVTATYVALRVSIDSWRWAGVPFYLRHGKRLPKKATEIAIQFRVPPMRLFGSATARSVQPNVLILNIQPDEGISLRFGSKVPGPDIRVRPVKMDFRYGHSFGVASPDAYERLLLDAITGDSTLFTRRDEVEHAWRFIDEIDRAWRDAGADGLRFYEAGTWGPQEADDLLEGDDVWRRL